MTIDKVNMFVVIVSFVRMTRRIENENSSESDHHHQIDAQTSQISTRTTTKTLIRSHIHTQTLQNAEYWKLYVIKPAPNEFIYCLDNCTL